MRAYIKTKTRKLLRSNMNGWIKGLNTLVSNTQLKENELSSAVDIQLVEDGKIQVPRTGQSYYGSESGTKVTGLLPFYKSDGTNQLLRVEGTSLQKYSSGNWVDITGKAYTNGQNMEGVMAFDNMFLCNANDNLSKYDGASIYDYTEVDSPSAPVITRTGTTGSYTYSYKVTSVTAVGETVGSPAGSSDLNQSELDETSYMTVDWTAVTDAIGYNVYGRKDGKWYFMDYLEGNASVQYVDKGTTTPQELFTPPEGDTTGGPNGKYVELYKDSLFIAGDPGNPSRLYYSAGGDLIDDFTVGSGGGFIDVSKNDGQVITGLKKYKDSLLVFKRNSIYAFTFATSGLPQVEQVTAAVGAVNQRGICTVENDVFFVSDRGVFTIGNEAGFAFDVLRTNELSAKVRSIFQSIDRSRIGNVACVYATVNNTNLFILSYTPTGGTANSKALVYDRERLAWYEWANISANCWANYRDSTGSEHVLYGDDSSGYVKEVLNGSDDFGSSIRGIFRTRGDNYSRSDLYKKLKDVNMNIRTPTGSIILRIIKDGVSVAKVVNLSTISPSVNFGHYVMGTFLLGESIGAGVSDADNNMLKTLLNVGIEGRSFLYEFDNNSSGRFVLLDLNTTAKARSERYRKSSDIVN